MKHISLLKVVSYIFSIIFALLILFPLVFMMSSAVKDDISVYEMPPKIIPDSPKSITFQVDYDEISIDDMMYDCALAMFGSVYEFSEAAIGEIIFRGQKDGKTVFYSRAHRQLLRIELDFGTYNGISISPKTISFNNKHRESVEKIGYKFDLNGIDKSISHMTDSDFSNEVKAVFSEKFTINGDLSEAVVTTKSSLLLENFKYYLTMPTYVYDEHPSINKYGFFAFFLNTILGLIVALATQVGLCGITAYALSKLFSPRVSQILLLFFMATLMIPFISIFVPLLTIMQNFGIKDGYLAMFFVHLYPDAFFIMIYKGFFDQLPKSLFEAAKIDGAPEWYTFMRICLPLSTPIISVIALNTFVKEWGNFFWYFAVANNTPKYWTINLAIYEMSLNPTMKANATMGIAVVMALPIIILSLVFSNKIKNSIATAGIKG